MEDASNTLGATLVEAARRHSMATAFSFQTDATGVLVQPLKSDAKKKHQPCRRGHFFVQLADKDFAFFEYVPRETSEVVAELFKASRLRPDRREERLRRAVPGAQRRDRAAGDHHVRHHLTPLSRRRLQPPLRASDTQIARGCVK